MVEEVNAWVENQTRGLITDLLSFAPPETDLIFANALFFHGENSIHRRLEIPTFTVLMELNYVFPSCPHTVLTNTVLNSTKVSKSFIYHTEEEAIIYKTIVISRC